MGHYEKYISKDLRTVVTFLTISLECNALRNKYGIIVTILVMSWSSVLNDRLWVGDLQNHLLERFEYIL